MGASIVDLRWGEVEGLVTHDAVSEETGVYTAVPAISLLWDGVACAAPKGPVSGILTLEDLGVFILDEPQGREGVFPAVFPGPALWYERVEVGDGGVREVNYDAGPVVAVPMEGHDKTVIRQGGPLVELVSPPAEPGPG